MRLNSNNELVSVACLIDEVMFIFELTGNYNLIINLNEAAVMIGSLVVLTGSFL